MARRIVRINSPGVNEVLKEAMFETIIDEAAAALKPADPRYKLEKVIVLGRYKVNIVDESRSALNHEANTHTLHNIKNSGNVN